VQNEGRDTRWERHKAESSDEKKGRKAKQKGGGRYAGDYTYAKGISSNLSKLTEKRAMESESDQYGKNAMISEGMGRREESRL